MKTRYEATTYNPELVKGRYVRKGFGGEGDYVVFYTDAKSRTLQECSADAAEIPVEVRAAADARFGLFPNQVEWAL